MKRWTVSMISCFILLVTVVLAGKAQAEPVLQQFTINQGWNAIFLEVEPVWFDETTELANPGKLPTDSDIVFASLETNGTSVWMWNPRLTTEEFIQDPSVQIQEGPGMLVYKFDNSIISNLYSIHGNTAYLINYGGTDNPTLEIKGEPLPPKINWKSNSFNFVGFHTAGPQVFENYFSSSPAHAEQDKYQLNNTTGLWVKVTAGDSFQKGEGFWVYCKGSSQFSGPVTIQLGQGRELLYGKVLEQQEVTLKNNSNIDPKTISLTLTEGSVPLYYWEYDPANDIARWSALPHSLDIAAGESQILKLGVKRTELNAETDYTANLRVSDGAGNNLFKVPVTVTGISTAGLWVGDAAINKVSQPSNCVGEGCVKPTGSVFSYRLIVHVDSSGQALLLNQVIQMWNETTGKFVLFSDDGLIPHFSGASLRDGQPVGRRISSPAFGNFYTANDATAYDGNKSRAFFKGMTGSSFAQPGGTSEASLFLPRGDSSNPFVHAFHPDHLTPELIDDPDNPGEQKWSQLEQGMFDITRNIKLTFTDTDSDGNSILGSTALGWGSSKIGGIYREEMDGLLRDDRDINIEGVFVLHRVSDIPTLTTTVP